jgi:hypothetical protein
MRYGYAFSAQLHIERAGRWVLSWNRPVLATLPDELTSASNEMPFDDAVLGETCNLLHVQLQRQGIDRRVTRLYTSARLRQQRADFGVAAGAARTMTLSFWEVLFSMAS